MKNFLLALLVLLLFNVRAFSQTDSIVCISRPDNIIVFGDLMGSFNETDSVIVQVGTTKGAKDISEFKNVLSIKSNSAGITGSYKIQPNSIKINYSFPVKNDKQVKNITVIIKRGSVILNKVQKQSAS